MSRILPVWATALCFCIGTGCSWMPWCDRKQPRQFGVLEIRLKKMPSKEKRATYAAVSPHESKGRERAGFQRLTNDGRAVFVLPIDASYDVRIFCDLNRNQALDAGEPNALAESLAPVPSTATQVIPVTLAFGVVGPVAGGTQGAPPAASSPRIQTLEIPSEALPYMKYVPEWVQDRFRQ
ncbi:MAG: hypothetical protein K1X78_05050 [Verrucomicrobiaceae bacterium]|nr:hypothetical protein [Verrucomicrobiaceae bacterium]